MKTLALTALLATSAALAACAPATPVATTAAAGVCGNYGYLDANNDGFVSNTEWDMYRSRAYGFWDMNGDGRVDKNEFERCYRAGGFYRSAYYNPDYWPHYWSAFDANGDGFLSADEYWSAAAWSRIDRNGNGRIDSNEWVWWSS